MTTGKEHNIIPLTFCRLENVGAGKDFSSSLAVVLPSWGVRLDISKTLHSSFVKWGSGGPGSEFIFTVDQSFRGKGVDS